MDDSIISLTYQKYEKYSVIYIISIDQIEKFIGLLVENEFDFNFDNTSDQLDQIIENKCYYNLLTSAVDNFQTKIKHNIGLAKENNDFKYLKYLTQKFQIKDDFTKI